MLLDPTLDLLKIVTTDRLKGFLGLLAQIIRVETAASTECIEQGLDVSFWSVTTGEDIKNLAKTNSKETVRLEVLLVAQEMKLDKKFIGCTSVQRGDDMREIMIKRTFAVSNGLSVTQVLGPTFSHLTIALLTAPLRS